MVPNGFSSSVGHALKEAGFANEMTWATESVKRLNNLREHHFRYGFIGELGGSFRFNGENNLRLKVSKQW